MSTTSPNLPNASMLETLADQFDALQRYDEAMAQLQKALSLTKDAAAASRIARKQATLLANQGEYRQASGMMELQLQALRPDMTHSDRAMDLDMGAQFLLGTGNVKRARDMLLEAQKLLEGAGAPGNDLLVNAWLQYEAQRDSGDKVGAAQAFERSHDLAFRIAGQDIDPQRYQAGFAAALEKLVPLSDPAYEQLKAGAAALPAGDSNRTFECWFNAAQRAAQAGDRYLSLWIQANIAATSMDLGADRLNLAIEVALAVRTQARECGYARPESMVTATLASLMSSNANVPLNVPMIGLAARAAVLSSVHAKLVSGIQLQKAQSVLTRPDPGAIDSILAKAAEEAGHDSLALAYYQSAVNKARAPGMSFELLNRLCGLHLAQRRQGDDAATAQTTAEIEQLLKAQNLSPRARIVGERTLGAYYASTDPETGLRHLRGATAAAESYRLSRPLEERRGFDREFRDVPSRLAELLRRRGDAQAAFDALQLGKGRSLIDRLGALHGGAQSPLNRPLTLMETQQLLAGPGQGTVLLDFAVIPTGIVTYCVSPGQLQVLVTTGSYAEFERVQFGDVEEREAQVVAATLASPLLRELARTVVDAVPPGSRVMLVADAFLHNLPLHAVPVKDRRWGEWMSFSYSPTAAILRFARPGAPAATALLAGDSVGNLPGARQECRDIGALFDTQPLLGPDCTFPAFSKALAQAPQIVHLSVHGRADMLHGGRSGLLFADAELGSQWVGVDALAAQQWSAALVVFSGCSTGVVGFRHGTEMLSAPTSALEAGASTVIASLWPVDDEAAKRLMTCFYKRLQAGLKTGSVDVRELLDEARRETAPAAGDASQQPRRDGRQFRPLGAADQKAQPVDAVTQEALSWAAFCVFGNPLLRLKSA